jgi:hypothetical protein
MLLLIILGYITIGYCWLFYWWIFYWWLVMAIGNYFIGGLLMTIGDY